MEIAMANPMNLGMPFVKVLSVMLPISVAIATLIVPAGSVVGQTYPTKPIKVICPLPSGSVVDVTIRLVTPGLSARLGVPVIVENRPGGGGTTGTKEFARAPSDGHTLLASGLNNVLAFRALEHEDVVPIATVASHHWLLVVRTSMPARSLGELIAHAKANPGKLTWGFGQGTSPHMFGELFKIAIGIDVVNVPYKSGTQAVPDLLGGRIDMNFGTASNLLPLIHEGKLRALAITSETRSPDLPDVPTMAESGFPQLTRGSWVGLWGPAGTPANLVSKLNREVNGSVAAPAIKEALKKLDFEPLVGSPQDFAAFIIEEMNTWTPAAKAAGILPK
jgi:tripartite-type tricarboxylate transporter receptor subunit TctC